MRNTRPQQSGTTTHAEWGSGHPHLLISADDDHLLHQITTDETRIGSADECEIRLPGLRPVHAVIWHDGRDDYDLEMRGPGETSANIRKATAEEGREVEPLHTGARFTAGPWRFVFVRDEYADHGRPYGGRLGGEGAHQRHQAPRPDYAHPAHPEEQPTASAHGTEPGPEEHLWGL